MSLELTEIGNVPSWDNGLIEGGIEEDYEGKIVLVTGGAKLFFYKETFTK